MKKAIFTMWAQGRENAPDVVKRVFESWEEFASDYEINILDQNDLNDNLSDLKINPRNLQIQAASDVLRTKLLAEHGGVWLDTTCFLTSPLDAWITPVTEPSGFFAFYRPGPDRLLSSWLLAAEVRHPFLIAMLPILQEYWKKPRLVTESRSIKHFNLRARWFNKRSRQDPLWSVRSDGGALTGFAPYFYWHYLFETMICSESEFSYLWTKTPKRSAMLALAVGRTLRNQTNGSITYSELQILKAVSPIHKLNWRCQYPDELFEV